MKRSRTFLVVVMIAVASAGLLLQCGAPADLLGTVEERVAEAKPDNTAPRAPTVTCTTPTTDTTPTWSWSSGSGDGNGTFRYKLNDNDLTIDATETTALEFTPGSALPYEEHTLYVQERDDAGNWSLSGSSMCAIQRATTITISNPSNPEFLLSPSSFTLQAGGGNTEETVMVNPGTGVTIDDTPYSDQFHFTVEEY